MTDSFKYQYSAKTPSGAMLNVRADTPEEFIQALTAALSAVPQQAALESALTAGSVVGAAGVVAPAQPASRPLPPRPAAANGPAPDPQVQNCMHGQRTFKSGTSAKGAWSAWFCPAPKGDPSQCKAIFL